MDKSPKVKQMQDLGPLIGGQARGLGARPLVGLAHYEVKGAGINLTEAFVSVERHRDRDSRIITFEFHSARDQQVVELINVERTAGLT